MSKHSRKTNILEKISNEEKPTVDTISNGKNNTLKKYIHEKQHIGKNIMLEKTCQKNILRKNFLIKYVGEK